MDQEVRNPRREGWLARDQWRRTTEAAEVARREHRFAIPFYRACPYFPDTPEREEWNAGWRDLDEALKFRVTHPDTLLGFSLPPRKRYRCSHCGVIYETMFHCQVLPSAAEWAAEAVAMDRAWQAYLDAQPKAAKEPDVTG